MRTLLASLALLLLLVAGLLLLRGRDADQPGGLPQPDEVEEAAPAGELVAGLDVKPSAPARQEPVVEERRPEAEKGVKEPPEAEGPPFRGVVLDVATEEPIPLLQADAGTFHFEVDADGRFDARRPLPSDQGDINFYDPVAGTHIRSIAGDALELRRGPWGSEYIARIAVGPTYRIHIPGAESTKGWRARLVELDAKGEEHVGSYVELHPVGAPGEGGVPFLRYDNPWEPNLPGSLFRIDVEGAEGLAGSSQPLVSAIGLYPEVVVVLPDREFGTLTGIVVDTRDEGQTGARVSAVPIGTGTGVARFRTKTTGGDGIFEITSLTPGPYRLNVQARRGQEPVSLDVEVLRGVNDVGKLVVDAHEPAGRIEGALANQSGAPIEDNLRVRLKAIDGRSFELLDVTSSVQQRFSVGSGIMALEIGDRELGAGSHVFEFASVPAGKYELSVLARDAVPWSPTTLMVTPPNEEVVFLRLDQNPTVEHVFAVRSENDVPIGAYFLQVQLGSAFSPRLVDRHPISFVAPPDATFTWSLRARGYRPAHGDQDAFRTDGARRLATVVLEHGWGARLILRDLGGGFLHDDDEDGTLSVASRSPVAGAKVLCDGKVAAESDRRGIADLALDELPEQITIDAPGWRLVEAGRLREGRIEGNAIDVVVWLVRR